MGFDWAARYVSGGARDRALTFARRLSAVREQLESKAAARYGLGPLIKALRRTETELTRTPRLVIAGEFNAGKSSLANVLIGGETLPTAALSNTRLPTLLRYAGTPIVIAALATGERRPLVGAPMEAMWDIQALEVGLPSARLADFEVVDIPGLSDPRLPDANYRSVLLSADAIIWCTTSIQAWRESEREVWMSLPPQTRRRGLLVATRRDLLKTAEDADMIMSRLHTETHGGFQHIVLVSSTWGSMALAAANPSEAETLYGQSGMTQLEACLADVITAGQERLLAKAKRIATRVAARSLARLS